MTPTPRPLVLTADPDVLEELLRLAATVGVELEVAPAAAAARRSWSSAPLVVVATDALASVERSRLPRRSGVVLLHDDQDDATVWQRAVAVGAEHVVLLPDAERWLAERFADALEGGTSSAPVVAVLGGRGGAGATTLACALAVSAVRRGARALLVDADPLGGGLDLALGAEDDGGARWPDLAATRGRLPAGALLDALPRPHGVAVLSWDRGPLLGVPPEAVAAVLDGGRRGSDLVVVDVPRALDDAARSALAAATTVLLVVPAEVRAAAAASRVATAVAGLCSDLRVVVRGPAPAGLPADAVTTALGLPLAVEMRGESGLGVALEHGVAPGQRARGPLAAACERLLDDLLPLAAARAA